MKRKTSALPGITVFALMLSFSVYAYHNIAGGPIIVNGEELNANQGQSLMQYYGPIPTGNYWYDPISGLWGLQGKPGTGQILPYLDIGGPLQANASGSGTGVFVNGREIHIKELAYLHPSGASVMTGNC